MLPAALIILTTLSFNALAQTGPAGIGNSTTNVLWLRSDQGTSSTTGGETVQYPFHPSQSNGEEFSELHFLKLYKNILKTIFLCDDCLQAL